MSSLLAHDPEALCASLGHELRNPLASVAMNLAVVETMTTEADPRRQFVDRIGLELGRIQELLDGLLSIGRGRRVECQTVDLGEIVTQFLSRRADAEGASTIVGGCDGLHTVSAVPGLLERVVGNLIENATAAGASRVEVSVSRDDDGTLLRVVDDGPGVPAELEGRIFDPFVGCGSGLGLGLAIVATVVASMDATIELRRVSDDGGTEAIVRFPEVS